MVKNNKKAISIVALVCIIFIMLILVSTITVSFNNIYISTKKKEFANEIYSIQKLVDQYYFRNNKYPILDNQVKIDLAMLKKEEATQFEEETDDLEDEVFFSELNLYEAGADSVKRGQKSDSDFDDIYIVSETTGKVYYKKGQKIGNNVYYTLTSELKKQLGL